MHAFSWMVLVWGTLFVHLYLCVCVSFCHVHARGIPTRYYATILCKTAGTKGLFHGRLFRSLYIKNATGWVMGYIVKYSLGALCPWFDSWEPGTVLTCESHVSGFSHIIVLIPTIWTVLREVIAGHFSISLDCFISQRGDFFCPSVLTLEVKL